MTFQCGKIIGYFPGGVFICTLDVGHKSEQHYNRAMVIENIVEKLAKKRRAEEKVWRVAR